MVSEPKAPGLTNFILDNPIAAGKAAGALTTAPASTAKFVVLAAAVAGTVG